MTNVLGIDLGNVIIDHLGFGTTTEYVLHGDYNSIPPVQGVMEALSVLNHSFNGNVFVVYNATDVVDHKILAWMEFHDVFGKTGIARNKIHRTEHGRDKSSVCLRYKATHFIDDRLEVLGHLIGIVPHLFLFRPQEQEMIEFTDSLPYVWRVESWSELLTCI